MITWFVIVSGLVVGAAFGYGLQRGRFCVNTAIRDILLIKDSTLLRAWTIAVLIQMVGVHLLVSFGLLNLNMAPYFWVATVTGGFVFGVGMVLAGGCASGICYRTGEGMVGATLALFGFATATVATNSGPLKPAQVFLRQWLLQPSEVSSLPGLFSLNPWVIIGTMVFLGGIWLVRSGKSSHQRGWKWQVSGTVLGIVGVLAWLTSTATGRNYGLSITGPVRTLFGYVTRGETNLIDWGSFSLIGLLMGAFLSSYLYNEWKLRVPEPKRIFQSLGGGIMMGFGAQVAGGCNIGHGFTGLSALALSSITATLFIILGAWSTAYLLFMRR